MLWPVIGSVVGGLIASKSTKSTNRSNADQSAAARKWNAKEDRLAERRHYVRTIRSERRAERSAIRSEDRAALRLRASEDRAYERLDPKNHRERMEAAGFNPLAAGIGSVSDIGSVSSVGMGSASTSGVASHNTPASFIAAEDNGPAIGRIIAQGIEGVGEQILAKDQLDIQRQQIDMERTRLNLLARKMTMTPKIPGIYGQRRENGKSSGLGASSGVPVQNGDSVGHTVETEGLTALKFPEGVTTLPLGPDIDEVVMGGLAKWKAGQEARDSARVTLSHLNHTGKLRSRPQSRPVTTRPYKTKIKEKKFASHKKRQHFKKSYPLWLQ